MNTMNAYASNNTSKERTINIENSAEKIPYNKQDHKEGKYGQNFIYICDKKTDEIFVINNPEGRSFNDIKQQYGPEGFDVFAFGNTGTVYNSYIPSSGGYVLQIKSKICNIMDFNEEESN